MNGLEKSDLPIVAMKSANEVARAAEELVERRGGTKENVDQQTMSGRRAGDPVQRQQRRISARLRRGRGRLGGNREVALGPVSSYRGVADGRFRHDQRTSAVGRFPRRESGTLGQQQADRGLPTDDQFRQLQSKTSNTNPKRGRPLRPMSLPPARETMACKPVKSRSPRHHRCSVREGRAAALDAIHNRLGMS
jgi:hypothetical protein